MIAPSQAPRTLVVASPLPPPATGVEMLTQALLQAPFDSDIRTIGGFPSRGRPAREKGAFTLRNILKTLEDCALLWRWLEQDPRSVVLTNLVQNAGGTLRYGLMILMARWRGIPVAALSHGDGFDRFLDRSPGWLRSWAGLTLRRINRVILHATGLAAQYEGLLAEGQAVVIPPGISCPEGAERRRAAGRPSVCFIGYLTRAKGAHDLIRVAKEILKTRDVEFHFIGDQLPVERNVTYVAGPADNSAELRALLGAEPDPRMIFHGPLADRQKWDVLSSCDIFTLPSHSEALPVSLLEALACGLPVVMTRVGGIPMTMQDGVQGILVTPGEIGELQTALLRLIDDPALRRKMGDAARSLYLGNHTLGLYAERLGALLRELQP